MAFRKNKKGLIPRLWNEPKKYIQAVSLLILVLVGLAHLRSAFLAQLAMNKGAQMANFSSTLTQPDALSSLARKEHLSNSNLPKALYLYRRSLAYFVLHVPSWLGVAELYYDMSEHEKGVQALRYADKIATGNAETAWAKALLAHDLDSEDVLVSNLVWLAKNHPAKMQDVFGLADLRWQDPTILMGHFGPALYQDLLSNYIRVNEPGKAATVWLEMEKIGTIPPESTLQYVNFLLSRDNVQEAGIIWRNAYQSDSNLLYNSALQEPFGGSGFAWGITRREGVSWQKLSDTDGLQIHFDGTTNPSFSLAQTVPLDPGSYVLAGYIQAEGLTTDQRPYWSVTGYKCKGLSSKGEMLPADTTREYFTHAFNVPDTCHAIRLALQRTTSYFFDNKIAGTVSLESLRLTPSLHSSQSEPQQLPKSLTILPVKKKNIPPNPTKQKKQTNTVIHIKKMKIK